MYRFTPPKCLTEPTIPPFWFKNAAERVSESIKLADQYSHPLAADKTWMRKDPHYFAKNNLIYANGENYRSMLNESHSGQTLRTHVGNRLFLQIDPTWDKWTTRLIVIHAQDIVNLERRRGPKALCLQSACILWGIPLLCIEAKTTILISRSNRSAKIRRSSLDIFPKNTVQAHTYSYDKEDIVEVDGIPVTSKLRTLLDVLARFPEPDYIVPGDALLRQLVNYDERNRSYRNEDYLKVRDNFLTLVSRQPNRFPSSRAIQRFMTLNPASESPSESLARFFLDTLGIDNYCLQYPVPFRGSGIDSYPLSEEELQNWDSGRDGPIRHIFVDIAIPEKRFALELDGMAKKLEGYSRSKADEKSLWKKQADQNQRDVLLRREFGEVVHVDWRRLWNWKSFVYAIKPILPKD